MASYAQGGWYDNPATGKNQQYWNGAFLPVGTTNNSASVKSPQSTAPAVDPAVAMQQEITKEYNAQNADYTSALAAYNKANPFNFDDMLAKETVQAGKNISPYYQQQLDTYMKGVNYLKGNTIQDNQRALTKLQADYDAYQGQAKALLNTTMTQVGQSYGNAGGYDTGARARAQGVQEANTAYDTGNSTRQYNYDKTSQQIATDRELNQTIPLAVQQENQTIANGEASDVNNQAQQLTAYDQAKNNYLAQQAAVAGVKSEGQFSTANTIPGLSSAQTQQQIQSLLPSVQVSSYGGVQATPILGYGG